MKKIFYIYLAIGIIFVFGLINFVNAQEEIEKTPEELFENMVSDAVSGNFTVVANVNLNNAKIVSQENNKFKLSFEIYNLENIQPDIRYSVQLSQATEKGDLLVDRHVYSEVIVLNQNDSTQKMIEYLAPVYLTGEYTLSIILKNQNGLVYSFLELGQITLKNELPYVEILASDCYLEVEGETNSRYQINQGVDISEDETLIASCLINNHYDSNMRLTVDFKTFHRTLFGQEVEVKFNTPQIVYLNANEVSQISFIIPKPLTPQAYDAKLSLLNESGEAVSNNVVFHYILTGKSATIQNFRIDKNYYNAGDTAHFSLFWSGSADRNFLSRKGATELGDIFLLVSVKDSMGIKCANDFLVLLDQNINVTEHNLEVTKTCVDPIISVIVQNDANQKLDEKSYALKSIIKQNFEQKSDYIDILYTYIFLIVILLILFILLIILHKRKKYQASIFFLLLSVGIFIQGYKANAVTITPTTSYGVKPMPFSSSVPWTTHEITLAATLNKSVFSPGESMTGTLVLTNNSCANTLLDMMLAIALKPNSYSNYYKSQNTGSYTLFPLDIDISHTSSAPTAAGGYNATFYFKDNRCDIFQLNSCNPALGPSHPSFTTSGLYVHNKTGIVNSVGAAPYGTSWTTTQIAQALIDASGSIYGHYLQYGIGSPNCTAYPNCDSPPLASPCKAVCDSMSSMSWNIPYTVEAAPTNGSCGTRSTTYPSTTTTWPTGSTYCSAGTNSSSPLFPAVGATVSWTCLGANGGTNASCSAARLALPINGSCGTKSQTYSSTVTAWPTGSTYCSAGANSSSPAFPAVGNTVAWTCLGANGGTNITCSAARLASSIAGSCGTRSTTYPSTTTAWPISSTYCLAGTNSSSPLFPAVGATVSWTCLGANGGTNVSCSAARLALPINGSCGTKSQTYSSTVTAWPTGSTYCSAGANSSSPAFPAVGNTVAWTCLGANGGTNITCSAIRNPAPINGECGSAHETIYYSAIKSLPTSLVLCAKGNLVSQSSITNYYYTWECKGLYDGSTVQCHTKNVKESKLSGYNNGLVVFLAEADTCESKLKIKTDTGIECIALTIESDPYASNFYIRYIDDNNEMITRALIKSLSD